MAYHLIASSVFLKKVIYRSHQVWTAQGYRIYIKRFFVSPKCRSNDRVGNMGWIVTGSMWDTRTFWEGPSIGELVDTIFLRLYAVL